MGLFTLYSDKLLFALTCCSKWLKDHLDHKNIPDKIYLDCLWGLTGIYLSKTKLFNFCS